MIFKTLPKELKAENIDHDTLNTICLETGYSPVILQPGDEPVELLRSEKGFFVKDNDGGYLRDKKGFFIVSEKDCQIGRARFLMKYGDREKIHKIQQLINRWEYYIKYRATEIRIGSKNLSGESASFLYKVIEEKYSEPTFQNMDHYSAISKLLADGYIVKLLDILKIHHTPDDLAIRSGTEGGIDGVRHYAAMQVNKEFPWLTKFSY